MYAKASTSWLHRPTKRSTQQPGRGRTQNTKVQRLGVLGLNTRSASACKSPLSENNQSLVGSHLSMVQLNDIKDLSLLPCLLSMQATTKQHWLLNWRRRAHDAGACRSCTRQYVNTVSQDIAIAAPRRPGRTKHVVKVTCDLGPKPRASLVW